MKNLRNKDIIALKNEQSNLKGLGVKGGVVKGEVRTSGGQTLFVDSQGIITDVSGNHVGDLNEIPMPGWLSRMVFETT